MIVVIAETTSGHLNRASIECVTAASRLDAHVVAVVPGTDTNVPAAALAGLAVAEVVRLEHDRLEPYTPDAMAAALTGFLTDTAATHVFLPHTYRTRDFGPRLAARLGRALVTDCVGATVANGRTVFSRQMFQGKVVADIEPGGPLPHLVSFQIGAFDAGDAPAGTAPAPIRLVHATIEARDLRQSPEPPFQETARTVDLSRAERIVAVGRGIREQPHVAMVQQLASALGAELAASRPICDAGWVPIERQIGSSGQTVAPRLYLALGISGAIQHVVGMKGSKTIVAVNKDADAPIFEIADYGIVGDIFEVVPALIAALDAR